MKRYLLPENGQFYKANLHCHTTVSDGKMTPEEIKETYLSRGYSIVAYTDHDIMVDHNDLADENFLPLLGYEIEITENKVHHGVPFHSVKTCHICLVAKDRETAKQVCYHRERYMIGNGAQYREQAKFDETLPDYVREYSHEGINDIIAKAKEGGFFVTYNHPVWSREDSGDFLGYEGMDAMEICNYGCYWAGYPEYNPYIYDQMLRAGKKIYCVGTDDNHVLAHCGGAFTVIKADKLDYATIMKSLEDGNFYASMGPEIHELWYEDGNVHIKCSPVHTITINFGIRRALHKIAPSYDELITEAAFPISPEAKYFRLSVTDEHGLHADTNAYFLEDIQD